MSEEISSIEVKKVKKVAKKKKSVTIDESSLTGITGDTEKKAKDPLACEVTKLDGDGTDNQLIFSGVYTKAMDKDFHSEHFACWKCDISLAASRYVLREDNPYCLTCYEEVFSNVCENCQKSIGIDSKDLSYKEKHWHESCFICTKCQATLVSRTFGSKEDKIYCSDCYDESFAARCDSCTQPFRAGMKRMEYKGKMWHDNCFVCVGCVKPIGSNSFVPKDEQTFCTGCYEEKFATRCKKCQLIIAAGGVTYKNDPWHRECFTCLECNTSLAGTRFTNRDDKPFCQDCFGNLFAKKCFSCTKPITGAGGTKFITFEDRNWHNGCFSCTACQLTLVGKGFITDGPEIICPDCAKTKLA